jgi:hypothetical protein
MHIYEVRPRRDKRGFDLISDALPLAQIRNMSLCAEPRLARSFLMQFRCPP